MKIRTIRVILPARLAREALPFAREAGMEIARGLRGGGTAPAPSIGVTVPGGGRNALLLARATGAVVVNAARRGRG